MNLDSTLMAALLPQAAGATISGQATSGNSSFTAGGLAPDSAPQASLSFAVLLSQQFNPDSNGIQTVQNAQFAFQMNQQQLAGTDLLLGAVRQALTELAELHGNGRMVEVRLDGAAGNDPAAPGQLPLAAGTPTAQLQAPADAALLLDTLGQVWARVAELVESWLATDTVQTGSSSRETEVFHGAAFALPSMLPAALASAPANSLQPLSQPLVLPDGSTALLVLSPEQQSSGETLRFTVNLINGEGQSLLTARLTVNSAGSTDLVPTNGKTINQPIDFNSQQAQSVMRPELFPNRPALPQAQPITQQQLLQVASQQQQQFVQPGELSRLLAQQPVQRPLGQPQPQARAVAAVAAETPRSVALPPDSGTLRSVALPQQPVNPARGVAIPVPMPQGEAVPARQAALPDPAAVLTRPLSQPDTVQTSGLAALWRGGQAADESGNPVQQSAKQVALPAAQTAERFSTVPQVSQDSAFTALRRIGELREAAAGNSGSASRQWTDSGVLAALGLSAAAGSSGLSPKLMPFTQAGMQFLPSGLDYSALAQRVLSAADSARAVGNGIYEARLELNPPQLGRMLAQIAVRGEQVAVQLAVASTVPRRQLEDGLSELKRSLEAAGLDVTGLRVVTLDPDSDNDKGSGGQQRPEHQWQETKRMVFYENQIENLVQSLEFRVQS